MTSYQRGNRDGLLNAAAEYDNDAKIALETRDRYESSPGFRPGSAHHALINEQYTNAWARNIKVANRLRALAEALPEDPECS